MASLVFNDFKRRFLTGGVPSADTWHFIPVNDSFRKTYEHDNIELAHYRNIQDFQDVNSSAFCFNTEKTYSSTNQLADTMTQVQNQIFNPNIKGINISKKGSTRIQIDTHNPTAWGGYSLLRGTQLIRHWTKAIDDGDTTNKPMFIKGSNRNGFLNYYRYAVSSNPLTADYIASGGFYFIRSKDELTWFAERANEGNNRIIGVLGDDIEGVINSPPIGKDEKYPFEGILDGNGYKLTNFTFICNGTDNGLVGVLGKNGIVRNFAIESDGSVNNLVCNKKINLDHIKHDSRDINCGLLVGRNYGTIQNIDAYKLHVMKMSGFVPEVYSVNNKSDNYTWSDGFIREKYDNANENYYFLNSFCINSPGNICPYVGYFAEGYYGENPYSWIRMVNEVSGNGCSSYMEPIEEGNGVNFKWNYTEDYTFNDINVADKIFLTTDVTYQNDEGESLTAENVLTGMKLKIWNDWSWSDATTATNGSIINIWDTDINDTDSNSTFYSDDTKSGQWIDLVKRAAKLPVYYFLDNKGYYTTVVAENDGDDEKAFFLYNSNLFIKESEEEDGGDFPTRAGSAYSQTSMRMHPMARAAYNIGIIAGANFGTIRQVSVKTQVQNTSNFVGFVGGIAGKQERGLVDNCAVDIDYNFVYDFGTQYSAGDAVVYKGTPLISQNCKNLFNGYKLSGTYADHSNIDILFSSFYDNEENVNTATDVTDDCITYKLRPIFVAGGLFGRWIPSFNSGTSAQFGVGSYGTRKYIWGTQLANTTVVYNDNYNTTNTTNGNFKRIENSLGVIAGKVDYETSNVGTNDEIIANLLPLQITNCVFSANVQADNTISGHAVGDPILMKSSLTNANSPTYWNKSRYFGVFELKYNELNSIAVLNHTPRESSDTYVGPSTNVSYALDYPWCHRYKDTCFEVSYSMSEDNKMDKWEGSAWGLSLPHKYNKTEMIPHLVSFNSCKTNIDPVFAYYEDYWRYSAANPLSANTPPPGEPRLFTIGNYDKSPGRLGAASNIIPAIEGIGVQNIYDGYTTISSTYQSSIYNAKDQTPDKAKVNYNTFTAVEGEYWNDNTKTYHNPRIFVKNISAQFEWTWQAANYSAKPQIQALSSQMYQNGNLIALTTNDTVAVSESNLNMSIGFNKGTEDNFFPYQYVTSGKTINPNMYGPGNCVETNNTFNFTMPVHFAQFDDNNNRLGYIIWDDRAGFQGDSGLNFQHNVISLGESLCPTAIRQEIKDAILAAGGDNRAGFYTSSVSANSDNEFAGILVVDSSGNNVMYIENNGLPLTGNSWNLPCPVINNNGGLLLEVK